MKLDTLAHPDESQSLRMHVLCVEALAVVLDHDGRGRGPAHKQDAHACSLGVLDDVRERLLHDSIESGFDLWRKALLAELRLDLDLHVRRLREGLCKPLERSGQSEVVESGRPELHRQAAYVLQGR